MGFLDAAGYGQQFSYTGANVRADGFENKILSGSVLRQVVGELVFGRAMNQSNDAFGVGKGGTFTVPIFKNWGSPATVQPLVSGTTIGIGTQKTDSVSMKMYEYGTGIGWETIGDWFTSIDVRTQLVQTLGNNISEAINWLDYDILVNNAKFFFNVPAAGSVGAVQYDAVGALTGTLRTAGANFGELGPGALAYASDFLKKSKVSPKTSRNQYMAFANARTLRNLKNGSVFQNVSLYTDMMGLKWQVLGEFMGYLFIETEEQIGDGTTLISGNNAAGFGFGLNPYVKFYPDFGEDADRLDVWKVKYYRGQDAIWRDKGTAAMLIRSNSGAFNYGLMD